MKTKTDSSLFSLVLINIIFGIYFIFEGGGIGTLLWVYWTQSVIIGAVNFVRILTQKNFSVEGLKINGRDAEKTEGQKIFVAFFFLIHYGFFHLGYFVFLMAEVPQNLNVALLLGAILFAVNHTFSFASHFKEESVVEKNIGKLMFYPYVRIVPMHFIIIFGGLYISAGEQALSAVVLFIILKTIADGFMHIFEHRLLKPTPLPTPSPTPDSPHTF